MQGVVCLPVQQLEIAEGPGGFDRVKAVRLENFAPCDGADEPLQAFAVAPTPARTVGLCVVTSGHREEARFAQADEHAQEFDC
ncbi:MAG: hypothetical protein ACR650_16675 [Methylocystis sp.]